MSTAHPTATHITLHEGGPWLEWHPWTIDTRSPPTIHSIKFADGSIWDTINGWRRANRAEAGPVNPNKDTTP